MKYSSHEQVVKNSQQFKQCSCPFSQFIQMNSLRLKYHSKGNRSKVSQYIVLNAAKKAFKLFVLVLPTIGRNRILNLAIFVNYHLKNSRGWL